MPSPAILCLGGATVDRKLRVQGALQLGTSNPVVASAHFGGVARNVCEGLARLGVAAGLHSLVGADAAGVGLRAHLAAAGADVSGLRAIEGAATAEYVAVLDAQGSLVVGLAAMAIFERFDADDVAAALARRPQWLFADANLPAACLAQLIAACRASGQKLAIDAVSAPKAIRLPQDCAGLDLLFLNGDEAAALLGASLPPDAAAAALRRRGIARVVLTLGARGLVVAGPAGVQAIAAQPARVADVTGAGDALVAATLARLLAGDPLAEAARIGTYAAALALESGDSVPPNPQDMR